MKDQDSDIHKETSKRSGFKKFFSRGKAEAPPRSNAVTGASTGVDGEAAQRADTGPISISQGAAQPLKADPSSTSTSKDTAPKVYSSLWEKALDTLKESKKESDRDAHQQLKKILKDPKTVSLHDINKAQENDLKNLSSKRDKQRFGNRRHVIRAAGYMLLFRGPAAAAGRFDTTGAATIAVQATTSLIGVSIRCVCWHVLDPNMLSSALYGHDVLKIRAISTLVSRCCRSHRSSMLRQAVE